MATDTRTASKKAATKKVARKTATRRAAAAPAAAPEAAMPAQQPPIALDEVIAEFIAAPAPIEKQKLVRDSFTMPKSDYALLDAMKQRLLQRSTAVKKSELLRAGVATLAAMSDDDLLATMSRVPSLKTGRPKKQKAAAKASGR